MQTAPLAYFSILIPILSNKVGNSVQEVTQTVLHLREIELLRQKKGTRQKRRTEREKSEKT